MEAGEPDCLLHGWYQVQRFCRQRARKIETIAKYSEQLTRVVVYRPIGRPGSGRAGSPWISHACRKAYVRRHADPASDELAIIRRGESSYDPPGSSACYFRFRAVRQGWEPV